MSALYGRLQGSRGEVTRLGHQTIESTLETWTGEIRTELERDGSFSVFIGPKNRPVIRVLVGNVNDDDRHYQPTDRAQAVPIEDAW